MIRLIELERLFVCLQDGTFTIREITDEEFKAHVITADKNGLLASGLKFESTVEFIKDLTGVSVGLQEKPMYIDDVKNDLLLLYTLGRFYICNWKPLDFYLPEEYVFMLKSHYYALYRGTWQGIIDGRASFVGHFPTWKAMCQYAEKLNLN